MPFPVVAQRGYELFHGAFFFVKNKVFDREERVDRCGEGNAFNRDEADFSAAPGDIKAFFSASFNEA